MTRVKLAHTGLLANNRACSQARQGCDGGSNIRQEPPPTKGPLPARLRPVNSRGALGLKFDSQLKEIAYAETDGVYAKAERALGPPFFFVGPAG